MSTSPGSKRWKNWSRLEQTTSQEVVSLRSAEEVAATVRSAAERGLRVKAVGSGHSFTGIALAPDVRVELLDLSGVQGIDRDPATGATTVTVGAGTRLFELNALLAEHDLALHNMGDVDRQTVAGAVSTGTHGTGGRWASVSAQVAGLTLVTGSGDEVTCSAQERPELFDAARVGLGALGVVTAVTFAVEPSFVLEADESPMTWAEVTSRFDELADDNHHFEFYWFPHTEGCLTKRDNRTLDDPEPPSRLRHLVDDELVSNGLFAGVVGAGRLVPSLVPPLNRFASKALSARTYSDTSHRVFVSRRRVRFREMEYAVPREVGMEALRAVRRLIEQQGWRIGFPVEVRHTPADDAWLSTSHGRDSVYLAFHVPLRTDHTAYFSGVERLLRDEYAGRPHWGKVHTRTAADLAPSYERFSDFLAVRDELDPQRVFTNDYLDRVLGP